MQPTPSPTRTKSFLGDTDRASRDRITGCTSTVPSGLPSGRSHLTSTPPLTLTPSERHSLLRSTLWPQTPRTFPTSGIPSGSRICWVCSSSLPEQTTGSR